MRAPFLPCLFLTLGCSVSTDTPDEQTTPGTDEPTDTAPTEYADVEAVSFAGENGAWAFTVTLRSPDVDCSQYADWWEVLTRDGELVYRRILNHSHPDEQPFARSGDAMKLEQEDELVVRGHMNELGYGGVAFGGSVAKGFAEDTGIMADFAAGVESQEPQVEDCWY